MTPAFNVPFIRRGSLCVLVTLLTACAGGAKPKESSAPALEAGVPVVAAPGTPVTPVRVPIIIEGTGKLVGTPAARSPGAATTGDGYQLNFIDTEIASVVASVIGDGLGLQYLVDPNVKGTMTLQATRALTRDEVLPALEAALNVQGVALVNANGVYEIVPGKDAPRRVTGLRGPGREGGVGFAIKIVPLRYVGVVDMEKVLRPFAPDGGILRVDEGRNLLLLAGSSRELSVMQDVVDTFDVNWLEGMSFGLYPVEYVDAKTLADELAVIFSETKSPIANVVRLVPLSRLSSLMVITHEPAYLKEVEAWIKRFDTGISTPGRRIYVYDVQNGKADDLADSLNKILSISSERFGSETPGTAGSSFDTPMNSSFRSAGAAGGILQPLAPRAAEPLRSAESDSVGVSGALKIVPNTENNALLLYATPSEFGVIEAALKRLDVVPIQVLIEASLAEVTLTDDMRYGVQWSYQSDRGPIVLSEASNGSISPQFPGFSYLYTGRQDIRAVLNAIESMTKVNVISSPKLLVLNNREAELQIGDQVPITVQSSVSTVGETAPIVNSVQLRDTGVILRITPRVNKSGLVLLDVSQEVSDVVPTTTSNIDSPTIQQRRISSTVAVRDGETIALGGLIRDSNARTKGGIPYLSRIPLIGELFGTTDKNSRRTELIVLITPRVVRSQRESEIMMDELREQFRGLRKALPIWKEKDKDKKEKISSEQPRENAPAAPVAAAP